jgi:ribosome biogenesis SPOUT family RNA methylase Rps3
MDITLSDVEIAMKILYEFIKKQKQAESLIARMGIAQRHMGAYGFSFEQFVNMAYQQVMEKRKSAEKIEEAAEPELTEEELARMREIAQKLKGQK